MPKGPRITGEVEALIARVYLDHPKWRAQEIRNEVSAILRKGRPELPPKWPGLSAVQKVLTTVRKRGRESEIDPQEKPWSMGTLDKYPISPEAIPEVLMVWKFRVEKGEGFTIREAKWAARLSSVIGANMLLEEEEEDFSALEAKWAATLARADGQETLLDVYRKAKNPRKLATETLSLWASGYAHQELLYHLINSDFDSNGLDRLLVGLSSTGEEFAEEATKVFAQLRGVRHDGKQPTKRRVKQNEGTPGETG